MAEVMATALTKVNDAYFPMIEKQLSGKGLIMDQYSRQCVMAAISAINVVLDSKAISWNDEQLDKSSITQILLSVASLKLNPSASPREVYFQLRNTSVKSKVNGEEVTTWKKQIEMGIEGDGNDSILSRFGRGVEKVYPYWLVRDQDKFEYPKFKGVEYDPPEWEQTGKGDALRIVYPVLHTDKTLHYYIAERADVAKNLIAHINNQMMNETFGICKDRYKATPDERKKITAKKTEILKKSSELGLASLDDPDIQQWISPAWTEYHSREAMIIRKMRNNAIKKIPKDFGNAFVEMTYSEVSDESIIEIKREIAENANTEPLDIVADPDVQPDIPVEQAPGGITTPQQEELILASPAPALDGKAPF